MSISLSESTRFTPFYHLMPYRIIDRSIYYKLYKVAGFYFENSPTTSLGAQLYRRHTISIHGWITKTDKIAAKKWEFFNVYSKHRKSMESVGYFRKLAELPEMFYQLDLILQRPRDNKIKQDLTKLVQLVTRKSTDRTICYKYVQYLIELDAVNAILEK